MKNLTLYIRPFSRDNHNAIYSFYFNNFKEALNWLSKKEIYNLFMFQALDNTLEQGNIIKKILKKTFLSFYFRSYEKEVFSKPFISNKSFKKLNLSNFIAIDDLFPKKESLKKDTRLYREELNEKLEKFVRQHIIKSYIIENEEDYGALGALFQLSSFYEDLKVDVVFKAAGKGLYKEQILSSFIGESLEKFNIFSTKGYLKKLEVVGAKEAFELFYGKSKFLAKENEKYSVLKDDEGKPFPIVALHMDINSFFEPFFYLEREKLKGLGLGVGFNKENAKLHSLAEAIEKYYIFEYENSLKEGKLFENFNVYLLKKEAFPYELSIFVPKRALIPTVIIDYFGQICGGSSLSESIALQRALAEAYPHNFYEALDKNCVERYRNFLNYLKKKDVKRVPEEFFSKDYSTGRC